MDEFKLINIESYQILAPLNWKEIDYDSTKYEFGIDTGNNQIFFNLKEYAKNIQNKIVTKNIVAFRFEINILSLNQDQLESHPESIGNIDILNENQLDFILHYIQNNLIFLK
ncbi:hypothetical protein OBJ96_11610 [Empedobacter falsenii]|uniref:Uncharacterized protein n=1 Tax=Empedobacter falsenii TaxID=343874 RepID=A0ABY8V7D7_9FLAO|nr:MULTISPECIES: hypothetical protein [Empedobacter]MCA4808999.1 hypothetical protein [Empedobacter stercoris]QNT14133.1 hypothetical protein HNV03_05375 [Empedobacter stercoris]WIH97591.1 hypothetical protein OBA43_01255 [Empedobacter falsenii]